MPITLKLGALVAARPALQRLSQQELPIMAAFKIGVRLRRADVELSTHEQLRNKLIMELGVQDPANANQYGIKPSDPNWASYATRLAELESVDVTLDCTPISLSEFGDQLKVSIADAMMLGPLVTE